VCEILVQARHMKSENEAIFRESYYEEEFRLRSHVMNWLSASDAHADQEYQCSLRASNPRSGHWLMKNHAFRSWIEPGGDSENTLWITGIPGSGTLSVIT
jgi:hypothetical protein